MTDEEKGAIEEDTVFYYSREHRLSRASPAVNALYDGQPMRPGLTRGLFATKGNIMVFITIVLIASVGFGSRFLGAGRESSTGLKLEGNTLTLAIAPVEGTLVLGILKNAAKSGEVYTGEVDIAVSPARPKPTEGEGGPQAFPHRIVFNPVDSEIYHIALPFEGDDFFVLLRTQDEQKSMRLNVTNPRHE